MKKLAILMLALILVFSLAISNLASGVKVINALYDNQEENSTSNAANPAMISEPDNSSNAYESESDNTADDGDVFNDSMPEQAVGSSIIAKTDSLALTLPNGLLFYESFDSLASIANNSGATNLLSTSFIPGMKGNAANMSGNRYARYPISGRINFLSGTFEFWAKIPSSNYYGILDIGQLSNPNSWGIFKNSNYIIMEVKNNVNSYDQAWSLYEMPSDNRWHHIAAPFYKSGSTTYFKICIDGVCKSSYDGIMSNSNPSSAGDFHIGWNYWYGFSQSIIDEFKIFNYAKSDSEIIADYQNYSEPYIAKPCIMPKPASTGPVRLNCSGLYVNNMPFTAKGVGYQPMPIGKDANFPSDRQAMYNDKRIFDRDFPLLRAMNVNTIRTWGEVMNVSLLDAAYNKGVSPIYVLMGFWVNCNEDYSNPTIRQNYINAFKAYVAKYKDHPAVLAWAIGNENNLGYCSSSSRVPYFYSLGNEMAKAAYEIEGANYHPVGMINGDLGSLGIGNSEDSFLNYTDFWGNNVYPGKSFGNWFERYSSLSGKPLLITEYGIDSFNYSSFSEYESVQAAWDYKQWYEINKSNVTIGSILMEYSDEYWKAGNANQRDYGGYATDRHPDGYSNEEWWGVVRITKNNSGGIDIATPRQVYYKLRNAFFVNLSIPFDNSGNLVKNPTFSLGLSNWTKGSGSKAIVQNLYESGVSFARITIPNANNIYCWNANVQNPSHCNSLIQTISNNGLYKNYIATVRFRAPVGTQGRIELIGIQGSWASSLYKTINIEGTGNWVEVQTPVLDAGSKYSSMQIRLITLSPNQANTYTDWTNVKVSEVLPPPGSNLVRNPDFSSGLSNWFKPSNSGIIIQNMSSQGTTFARITIPNANNIYCWNANISNPSHCNSLIQDILNTMPNKTYALKAKVRMPVGTQAKLEIYALPWAGAFSKTKTINGNGSWQDINISITTTSANKDIQVRLVTLSPNQANTYTDWTNVSVIQI